MLVRMLQAFWGLLSRALKTHDMTVIMTRRNVSLFVGKLGNAVGDLARIVGQRLQAKHAPVDGSSRWPTLMLFNTKGRGRRGIAERVHRWVETDQAKDRTGYNMVQPHIPSYRGQRRRSLSKHPQIVAHLLGRSDGMAKWVQSTGIPVYRYKNSIRRKFEHTEASSANFRTKLYKDPLCTPLT